MTGGTVFLPPFDKVAADSLTDGGTENVTSKTRAGETAKITSHVSARLHGSRWSGPTGSRWSSATRARSSTDVLGHGITWRAQ